MKSATEFNEQPGEYNELHWEYSEPFNEYNYTPCVQFPDIMCLYVITFVRCLEVAGGRYPAPYKRLMKSKLASNCCAKSWALDHKAR